MNMEVQTNQQQTLKEAQALCVQYQSEVGRIRKQQKELFEKSINVLEQRKINAIKEQIWKLNV